MQVVRNALLALLESALPASVAEEVTGDLAEEQAAHSLLWLVWQSALAIGVLRRAQLRERRVRLAFLSASIAAAVTLVATTTFWHFVLTLVPRRAGHAPGFGWLTMMTLSAAVAAAFVSVAVTSPREQRIDP